MKYYNKQKANYYIKYKFDLYLEFMICMKLDFKLLNKKYNIKTKESGKFNKS